MRCFDFCRSEMFHSTRSACVLICQNFSKVSAFSPKTYLYIFYFSEKGEKKKFKKREKKNIIISMAPQEAELYPRNEEPRDSSPKVQTFRHLVIPPLACSHTKSRRLLSQTLAGTLPPPQVSPGSFGFDFERLQGQAVQQSWACVAGKGARWHWRWGLQGAVACWPSWLLFWRSFPIFWVTVWCLSTSGWRKQEPGDPPSCSKGSIPAQDLGGSTCQCRNGQDSASAVCWSL